LLGRKTPRPASPWLAGDDSVAPALVIGARRTRVPSWRSSPHIYPLWYYAALVGRLAKPGGTGRGRGRPIGATRDAALSSAAVARSPTPQWIKRCAGAQGRIPRPGPSRAAVAGPARPPWSERAGGRIPVPLTERPGLLKPAGLRVVGTLTDLGLTPGGDGRRTPRSHGASDAAEMKGSHTPCFRSGFWPPAAPRLAPKAGRPHGAPTAQLRGRDQAAADAEVPLVPLGRTNCVSTAPRPNSHSRGLRDTGLFPAAPPTSGRTRTAGATAWEPASRRKSQGVDLRHASDQVEGVGRTSEEQPAAARGPRLIDGLTTLSTPPGWVHPTPRRRRARPSSAANPCAG